MAELAPLLDAAAIVAASKGALTITDPRLPSLIRGATAAVRHYCGWHVTPVLEETLTLDHVGGDLVQLPTLRVEAVTAVTVWDGLADVVLDPAVTSPRPWRLSRKTGQLRLAVPRPAAFEALAVTLRHGFEPTEAADLIQVVSQVVLVACSSPMGATREQAGAISVAWATTAPGVSGGLSLLGRDQAVLDRYRLPKVSGR